MEKKLLYQDKSVEPWSQGLNGYFTTGMRLRMDPEKSRYEEGVVQLTGLTKNKKPSSASIAIPLLDVPQLIQALQELYDAHRPE